MISDQPLDARVVNLDVLADALTAALLSQPGLLRLEPTVRSVMQKFKITSKVLRQDTEAAGGQTSTATRDGLHITVDDGLVHVQADIATAIDHRALGLAEHAQEIIADTIRRNGLRVGGVDVTILAIEASPGH
ncbi:hypothetical protein ACU18_00405 [Arthrobacter sp. ZBG10]|jgi:hypothetical protein|uniref:hypothetical protein n=1 Tax=Micrococcaceae TaxID=1268 RepID=UPI000681CBC9|nr:MULTISPECIES: hypothetical protein [Micrococcaceae]KNH23064.1 hypothetical protein ACU18_00405 [Arthrobacter sp. ZBG10]KQQ92208.1 hypothetical protein ASF72_03155 [Arthrobacter sp. Leaf141]